MPTDETRWQQPFPELGTEGNPDVVGDGQNPDELTANPSTYTNAAVGTWSPIAFG